MSQAWTFVRLGSLTRLRTLAAPQKVRPVVKSGRRASAPQDGQLMAQHDESPIP